jgi:D-glycero-alpha-D-manno-heptose 1-phosphate guanylyltransferase
MDAIILAGGLGTRLRAAVNDVPKCMAPVNSYPFLYYILSQLQKNKVTHVILSLGYKHETVIKWIEKNQFNCLISCIVENEPLGTGGAVKTALNKVKTKEALILNGDTFFDIDINAFYQFHVQHNADISIALKPMSKFDRYGSVAINNLNRVVKFHEKEYCDYGYINGGCYLLQKDSFIFENIQLSAFSFEKEILEKNTATGKIYGYINDGYFIDIGIPEDYRKANEDFKNTIKSEHE